MIALKILLELTGWENIGIPEKIVTYKVIIGYGRFITALSMEAGRTYFMLRDNNIKWKFFMEAKWYFLDNTVKFLCWMISTFFRKKS